MIYEKYEKTILVVLAQHKVILGSNFFLLV